MKRLDDGFNHGSDADAEFLVGWDAWHPGLDATGISVSVASAPSGEVLLDNGTIQTVGDPSEPDAGLAAAELLTGSAFDPLSSLASLADPSSAPGDQGTSAAAIPGGANAAQVLQALNATGLGVNGSGIKVGVISDSFNDKGGAAADEASGALPSASNVQVLKDLASGGTDEGRAMMQIVHEIAPGASLAFYTADVSEQDFANGILALAAAGCKVICDDVSYFDEPMFQNGIVAQAIQTVEAEGVTYVAAAANNASNGYQAAWRPISGTFGGFQFFDAESFNGSLAQTITVTASSTHPVPLLLEWDRAYGQASFSAGQPDIDMFVFQNGSLIAQATNADVGEPNNPFTGYQFTASGTYQIVISNNFGSDPGMIKEVLFGNGASVSISGANAGTVYGHSMTPGAITAGAVSVASTPAFGISPALSESFSSSGAGAELLFANDGTRLSSPQLLSPVVVSGVDGIATTVPGGLSDFFGTSAASASLAGVAALILAANPGLTPAQVEQIMEQTALPMANSAVSGAGLVQVNAAVAAAQALLPPDLIEYVEVNKTTVTAGGSVTVDAWVDNLGRGPSPGSTAQIYLSTDATITTSDTVLATLTSGSLAVVAQPGYTDHQTVTVNLPANLAPGTYYVGGIADYNNHISESNESNNNYNVVQITVTGPPQPDLSEYVAVNKTTVSAGDSIIIDAYDMNLGNAVSPGSTAQIYLSTDATITTSDTVLATVTNAESLATVSQPGYYDHQAVTVNLPSNLAPGTYYVGGIADYNNQVVESNESNNTYDVVQITVTAPPQPDLIEYVEVNKTTVAAGGSITVDAWVDNLGNGASAGSTAQIYLSTDPTITTSDTVLATLTSGSLAVVAQPGYTDHQTVTVNLPGNLAPGTYYVGGIADYNGHISESNESNNNYNTVQITVTGPPQPDLIEYVEVNKTTVAAGGSVTVDAWVDNLGNGASAGSTAQIYLSTDPTITTSDTVLATLTSGSLAVVAQPGYTDHQTVTVNLPANLAPGTYYVGGIADYNNHVGESNESNNNYNVVQITVGASHAQPSANFLTSPDNFSLVADLGANSHPLAAPPTSGFNAAPEAAGHELASATGAMATEAQHLQQLVADVPDAASHAASLGGLSPADVHAIQAASGFIVH